MRRDEKEVSEKEGGILFLFDNLVFYVSSAFLALHLEDLCLHFVFSFDSFELFRTLSFPFFPHFTLFWRRDCVCIRIGVQESGEDVDFHIELHG